MMIDAESLNYIKFRMSKLICSREWDLLVNTSFSLNYETFDKENIAQEKGAEQFKSVFDYKSDLNFISPKYELSLVEKDTILADKRLAWHKNLSKDVYVFEALNVLSELKLKPTNN